MSQNLTNIYNQGRIKIEVLHVMQKLEEGTSHITNFVLQSNKVLVYTSFTIKFLISFLNDFIFLLWSILQKLKEGIMGNTKEQQKPPLPPPTLWSNAFF